MMWYSKDDCTARLSTWRMHHVPLVFFFFFFFQNSVCARREIGCIWVFRASSLWYQITECKHCAKEIVSSTKMAETLNACDSNVLWRSSTWVPSVISRLVSKQCKGPKTFGATYSDVTMWGQGTDSPSMNSSLCNEFPPQKGINTQSSFFPPGLEKPIERSRTCLQKGHKTPFSAFSATSEMVFSQTELNSNHGTAFVGRMKAGSCSMSRKT